MAKILIADDEPRIRELIQEHLEHEGYQCTQASDGAAALAAVAAGGVDLVILDVMMPFMAEGDAPARAGRACYHSHCARRGV